MFSNQLRSKIAQSRANFVYLRRINLQKINRFPWKLSEINKGQVFS
jgi:hypothetical protein